MVRCLEDDDIGAGVVWEVLKGNYRKVGWRNDPGPSGPGADNTDATPMNAEVYGWLSQPGWGQSNK